MVVSTYRARRIGRAFIAALIAATCGSAASASTANLIANGGFEDGATGFSSSFVGVSPGVPGAGDYSVTGSIAGLGANEGSQALFISPSEAALFQRIWGQDITVIGGVTYAISGDIGTWNTGLQPGAFNVILGGALVGGVTAPADDTWRRFSFLYTAPGSGTFSLDLVEVASGPDAGDYALDALSMTAVPLPAGLPLLAGALGALALRRRAGRRTREG